MVAFTSGGARATLKARISIKLWSEMRALLNRRRKEGRAAHLALGESGERAALQYLIEQQGYEVVVTNFLVPLRRCLGSHKLTPLTHFVPFDTPTLAFLP